MAKTKLNTKTKAPDWYVAKQIIKDKGITYEKLGEMLGISRTSAFQVTNYAPSILHVKAMADALKVPFNKFFDFSKKGE